jgi:hypothetical protein
MEAALLGLEHHLGLLHLDEVVAHEYAPISVRRS